MTTLNALPLPDALTWSDEFAPQSVAQTVKRTLDGGVVVFHSRLITGQRITLQSRDDAGWVTHATLHALKQLADTPGEAMTLTLRGQPYRVMFRHHEPPALEADPVFPFDQPDPTDFYRITLKFITL